MTSETLFRLVELFEKGSIARLAFSQGDCRLELEKPAPAAAALSAAPGAPAPAPAAAEEKADEGETIASPLVGTFYAAPSPGAAPFVTPGERVKKGQTVCIIEAMKMINEVPAPHDGVIGACLAEDGALVGFGDALFTLLEN